MKRAKIKGIIPRILTIYFLVQYIFYLISSQYEINLEYLNVLMFSVLFIYAIFKLNGEPLLKWISTWIIYICILLAALSFTSIFATDSAASSTRVLVTCWLLFTMVIVFFYTIKNSHEITGWESAISKSLVLMLIIALSGNYLIPEWQWQTASSTRFGGGINPNGMAHLAFFSNFWFMYQITSENKGKLVRLGWILSIVIVVLSMSRTIFLSIGLLYIFYIFFLALAKEIKINGKQFLSLLFLGAISIFIVNAIQNTMWYEILMGRFSNEASVSARQSAWLVLQNIFYENPLVGGVGWWQSTIVLSSVGAATDTAHNLYLRILAETGLIGTIPILFLPLILLISLIYLGFKVKITTFKKQVFIVASMIIGIFAGMMFEDRYLVGLGGFNNGPIVWVLTMAIFLIYYSQKSNKSKVDLE